MTYLLNADRRQLVHVEIRDFASQYLAGDAGVIETSRRLSPYAHVVEGVDLSVHETLRTFVATDSETDDLPTGLVREMWHPSTATLQDQSILDAEMLEAVEIDPSSSHRSGSGRGEVHRRERRRVGLADRGSQYVSPVD
jgi:hypothetical protein